MENKRRVMAIIVAAGKGSRFGSSVPKQFCNLGGRPVLMTTINRIAEAVTLDNIVLVIDASMEDFWKNLCAKFSFESPSIVYGGSTRWESVRNAVDSLQCSGSTVVMVHDGARPLASVPFLKRMAGLDPEGGIWIPAVKVTDSLRYIGNDRSESVDRSRYVAVQTPQVASAATLKAAYSHPFDERMTDDASVVEASGAGVVMLTEGEPTNIKITNPLDLVIAEAILNRWTH